MANRLTKGKGLFGSTYTTGPAHVGGTFGVVGAAVFAAGVTAGAGAAVKATNFGTLSVVHGTILPNRMGTVSMAMAGVVAADIVILNPPAAPTAGLGYAGCAPAAGGSIAVFLVNPTAGTVSPGTIAFTSLHIDLT